MIRITIELIPFGVGPPRHLGTMVIGNEGTSKTLSKGNYRYYLYNKAKRRWRGGRIEDFPRKKLLSWDLIYRILRKEFGERNEE